MKVLEEVAQDVQSNNLAGLSLANHSSLRPLRIPV